MRRLATVVLVMASMQLGCLQTKTSSNAPASIQPPIIPDDAFITLKAPLPAHAELCAKDGALAFALVLLALATRAAGRRWR